MTFTDQTEPPERSDSRWLSFVGGGQVSADILEEGLLENRHPELNAENDNQHPRQAPPDSHLDELP